MSDVPDSIASLVSAVVQYVPGCPDSLIEQELANAWRDFCKRSEWWRPPIDITLQAGTSTYTVEPPADAHVRRIIEVYRRTAEDVEEDRDGSPLHSTLWKFAEVDETYTIRLRFTVGEAAPYGLRIKAVLVPKIATDEPPSVSALERWGDTVAAGAAMKLALMPKKAWTNVTVASERDLEFRRGISAARRENQDNSNRL